MLLTPSKLKPKSRSQNLCSFSFSSYYSGDYDENIKYSLKAIELLKNKMTLKMYHQSIGELGSAKSNQSSRCREKYMMKGLRIAERENL
jgi:hypothetical protein